MELNTTINYAPNGGQWLQRLSSSEIIQPNIVVTASGAGFKTRYPNIFADYTISNASNELIKLYNSDNYMQIYTCIVNFAVHCSTTALGIAIEHINSKEPLVASLFRFHLYYQVRKVLYQLKVKLPSEAGFNPLKSDYDIEAYEDICNDYQVDPESEWRNQYLLSTQQGPAAAKRKFVESLDYAEQPWLNKTRR